MVWQVLDRVFYTMGQHMGKFLLLVTQMLVTYWCVFLFKLMTAHRTMVTWRVPHVVAI